jgi:NIPSNAP
MTRLLTCAALLTLTGALTAADKDKRLFELRIYSAAEGKLDALNARFRDHTCKLFEKHGMTNIGYWTPIENPDHKLIYILAHKDKNAAAASWKAFGADPDWQKAYKESEKDGKLLAKAPERKFLTATDYSAAIKAGSNGERVFELRTYTAAPNALDQLNARFRNHTCKLFEKHGMTNIGYWVPANGEKGADNTLIYILAHKSQDAAKASFDAFRQDPDWVAVKKQSEDNAGGSLTVKDGVKSVFMKATDYSPIK